MIALKGVLGLSFLVVALVFASSGHANELLPITLTLADNGAHVNLQRGQELKTSLCSPSEALWTVEPGIEAILRQEGAQRCTPVSNCNSIFGPGDTVCTSTFRSIAPGQALLLFTNAGPHPTPTTPIYFFHAVVTVSASVPSMTEWGLILFAVFSFIGSVIYLKKAKTLRSFSLQSSVNSEVNSDLNKNINRKPKDRRTIKSRRR